MRKKILALLLSVGVMFNACPVFAASTANISSSEGSYVFDYSESETFTVDFTVSNNENVGFNNATFYITYDPSVIQAVSNDTYAEDTITYEDNSGNTMPFISNSLINKQLSIAPEGVSNATGNSAESGKIKIAAMISSFDANNNLISVYDNGTMFRLKFKMIGAGSTKVTLTDCVFGKFTDGNGEKVYMSISPAEVKINGEASSQATTSADTTTTEATTQTTTKSSSSNSASGSNTTTTTTTTTATQATTKGDIATEATTAEVTEATTASAVNKFNDISDYPWASAAINTLAEKSVINGYSDGSFKPTAQVKRADFLIMLLKAMGTDITKTPASNFSDVESGAYYANAVGLAKEMGIANGNGDGTFSPESTITRQDMMILAKKALEIKTGNVITGDSSVLDKFSDKAQISSYAVESLAAMVSDGLVNGTGNNIEPKANTTRAQAAVIINKLFEKMN